MRLLEPTQITAGESLEWTRTLDDYPANEWTLEYRFRSTDGPGFNTTATADGTDFLVDVASTVTAKMSAGKYLWEAWLTNIADTTVIRMVTAGFTMVRAGFNADSTAPVDIRSQARRTYDAIVATIENRASASQQEYEISTPAGTKRLKYVPLGDLITLKKHYSTIVAQENAAERARTTGKFGTPIKARLSDQ